MKNLAQREPLITAAVISALASAIVQLLITFGVPLVDDQVEAIARFVGVIAPFGVVFARKYVSPIFSPEEDESDASE